MTLSRLFHRFCMLGLLFVTGLLSVSCSAVAQTLDTNFSCSTTQKEDGDGEKLLYADQAKIRLDGERILALQWESSLFRTSHGNECSMDESDEPQAEVTYKGWRITLKDARAARERRGYDTDRGTTCSVRLEIKGDDLELKPTCPVLCGSRSNFTALKVNIKTGMCHYEE